MRKISFILLFLGTAPLLYTQDKTMLLVSYPQKKIENLLKKGIEYHDIRQYDKAIEIYRQILRVDSTSVETMYELSLSLLQSGDFKSAITWSDRLIDRNDKYAILAYNTKGSALNYMERTDEAIIVFLEGISRYEDFDYLYYNLGLAYFVKEEYPKAKEAFQQTLKLTPKHVGAHLNLGRTMAAMNKRIEAILGLYYFLLLEPATDRSDVAYSIVQDLLYNRRISTNEIQSDDDPFGLFVEETKAFFATLDDINEVTNPAEASVWDNYLSFFKTLSLRGYTEPFCYYICYRLREENGGWRKQNEVNLTDFARWLAQQE